MNTSSTYLNNLESFKEELLRNRIPASMEPFYLKWFRYYVDFCEKYHFDMILRESIRRSTRKSTGSGERSSVRPSISFLNAATSKRDLHGWNARIAERSFSSHFPAASAAAARRATRNGRCCLPIVSKMKYLPTCRIGSGFLQYRSGCGFIYGSTEVF
jgi:hypothetical protein